LACEYYCFCFFFLIFQDFLNDFFS
jgi:hypothetical protein